MRVLLVLFLVMNLLLSVGQLIVFVPLVFSCRPALYRLDICSFLAFYY
jgi:hypothetical protein